MKLYITILALIFTTSSLFGQEFIWDIKFAGQFDNREYNTVLTRSQTLFGARITPQIGIGWGHNSINVGTDLMGDFGAKTLSTDPTLLLYYAYNSKKFDAYMGVFPRSKMIGKYSSLFFSDSVKFYDQNLDGFMLQRSGDNGYIEIGIDWCGLSSGSNRERFMIFSSGEYQWSTFFVGYSATIFHFAASEEVTGVVDNILFNPYIGVNLSNQLPLDVASLQVGWVQGLHKDRLVDTEFKMQGGAQVELRAEKWNFGLYNTLYLGTDQMPYYDDYGSGLYFGDPYYRTEMATSSSDANQGCEIGGDSRYIYNRFEAYWHPYKGELFNLKVSSVHHYDGFVWGWQQLLTLNININKGSFKNKVKYIRE